MKNHLRDFVNKFGMLSLGYHDKREYLAFILFAFAILFLPFSMPASRLFAAISLLLLIIFEFDEAKKPKFPLTAWLWIVFSVVAVLTTYMGVAPEVGVPKLRQLIWWFLLPLSATLADTPERRIILVKCMVVGMFVLAIRMLVEMPLKAMRFVEEGVVTSFSQGIIHAGSMTHAQRLMIGVILAVSLMFSYKQDRSLNRIFGFLTIFVGLALIINFKRGSWICTVICLILFSARYINKRGWLLILLFFAIFLNVPIVKTRIFSLQQEFQEASGGRWLMWRKIAPAIIKDYPEGIGWHSLTNEWMKEIDYRVEPNRTHLHSNILQVLAETGWFGFIVYSIWMLRALVDAFGFRLFSFGSKEYEIAGGIFFSIFALLLNGIVEYNFGDSEIIMIYAFLIGIAASGFSSFIKAGKTSN